MYDSPEHVDDELILAVVRRHWDGAVDAVTHLAVGYGGYHWRASVDGRATYFVTLDFPAPRHTGDSLETAYAAAAALAGELDFVWAGLPTREGRYTVPLGSDFVSVTRWLVGQRPLLEPAWLGDALARLHALAAPPLPSWQRLVEETLPDHLSVLTATPWTSTPYGEAARAAIRPQLRQIAGWSAEYHAHILDPGSYVATHGEPGVHNQMRTPAGATYLVDWESLLLAPRERDLATFFAEGHRVEADPSMIRLMDLDWRLSEIQMYAEQLAADHPDNQDSRIALDGLKNELTRPHWDG